MSRILPRRTLETSQLNLLLCDSKPVTLPVDKQRELELALADLLLSAVTEAGEAVEEVQE